MKQLLAQGKNKHNMTSVSNEQFLQSYTNL